MMSFEDRISICQYFGVVWHVMLELISTGVTQKHPEPAVRVH